MNGLAVLLTLASCAASGPASRPALGSQDLALLYSTAVPASRELAEYYAHRRGVPEEHLIGLALTDEETLDRDAYPAVVERLRRAMREAGLEDRVRCLVTFYGLPIRVGPIHPTTTQQAVAGRLEQELAAAVVELAQQVEELESLARAGSGSPATRPAETAGAGAGEAVSPDRSALSRPVSDVGRRDQGPAHEDGIIDIDLKQLAERYERAKVAAVRRLHDKTGDPDRHAMARRFFLIIEEVEGRAGLVAHLRQAPEGAHPSAVRSLEALQAGLKETQDRINRLVRSPLESPQREEARRLVRGFQGLRGSIHVLRDDRDRLTGQETAAAFDSELALLWWDDYPLHRWQMNLLSWRVRADETLRRAIPTEQWQRRTLMVSRLDGPTPGVVRRMIDDAIEAERSGLRGTCYIDARGIARDGPYGTYDQNLRDWAALLTKRSSWPTVLDDREGLFGPGQCPDAALYCGWYSLRDYVPAFTFCRGAVGYHIASGEAVRLRGADETGWCAKMIREGVAATLGPVGEPYLYAFPLPKDFFGLLMTGGFTLAECYAFTSPFNSWMMMLLGDPLYSPFSGRPVWSLSAIFDARLIPPEHRPSTQISYGMSPGPEALSPAVPR